MIMALLPVLWLSAGGQMLHRAPSTDGYELVFSDEFDGNALDTQVWNVEVNGDGGGNNELQYYTRGNVRVADGALRLTARRESYGNRSFTSGRINSMGKVAFKHGIVQASIQLPSTANGLWPAFWLMGNDMSTGAGWPYCGEIDVLEAGGSQGIAAGTQDRFFISALHWGPYTNGQHPMYSRNTTAPYSLQDGAFHLYTLVWDENKIAMYLDDQASPYFEMSISDTSQQNSAGNYFHKQFFLLFNMAVGGNIPGIFESSGITALASGERTMSVDYVRVYQKAGEEDYTTPGGSQGGEDPEVPEDTTTELGAYGSLSLDDSNQPTFDFEHATDFVVIGASQGVIDQMGDRIRANYSVDDVDNYLYVWENTYTAQETEGLNSFGLDEPWNSYRVNSVGWSGLGYASTGSSGTGKDMSMLDDDGYILHLALRGTDPLMHTAQAVYVGAAAFTLGAAPFVDGNKTLPVLGDYKRDGRWCSFDIPVSVLKNLATPLYPDMAAVKDNVLYFLSGGNAGAQLQFDNIFFYKNPNVNTDLPDEDTTTVIGQYASRSLDEYGRTTFDFDDAYDYVVIGASQGVMDQMGDRIRANYSVDNVNNFLYVWENTYTAQETEGVNSFGLAEPWNSYRVNAVGWSGLGYASQGAGKDLTMLDDTYYLHLAMRGTDLLRHTCHTVGVGAAQFVIGNATTGPVMLGDYKRDGQWYSFDIPFAVLRAMAGDPFEGQAASYVGNVLSILSGGAEGAELQFDNVFFYRRHSDEGQQPGYDLELGRYGSKALDEQGNPTFDLAAHTDYVLIALGAEEARQIQECTLADYRVDGRNHFLYIWDGTYNAGTATGVNSFGYREGYSSLTVGSIGWSGLGFASTGGNGTGKDLGMIDDSFTLHLAFKGSDAQHVSHAIGVGAAHFALGQAPFVDGDKIYGLLGDFKRDGEWYAFDIPYSEIAARANPVFANASNYVDNVISILSGGVEGVDLNFDAIFFYRDKANDSLPGDLNGDGLIDIDDVNMIINIILGRVPTQTASDLNADGTVDVDDMNAIINIVLNGKS